MDNVKILAVLQAHWQFVTFVAGIVLIVISVWSFVLAL